MNDFSPESFEKKDLPFVLTDLVQVLEVKS